MIENHASQTNGRTYVLGEFHPLVLLLDHFDQGKDHFVLSALKWVVP